MDHLEKPNNHFLRAETNLLRFPFFALKNAGLWSTERIECDGEATDDREVCRWHWEVRRGPGLPFPGSLAHAAHMAFLEIMTERGLPFENPVAWTWRDLCRRMEVSYKGALVPDIQQAVCSTKGALIFSQQALKDRSTGMRITSKSAMSLYDRAVFQREAMPGGGEADRNYVWLSQWYLDSLSAGYTAPLDHDLWKYLHRKSTVASRLYEYFRFATWRKAELPIRYEKLAAYLPVTPVRTISKAKERLAPAFALLKESGVAEVVWPESLETPLRIVRGIRLAPDRRGKVIEYPTIAPTVDVPSGGPAGQSVREEQQLIDLWYIKRFPGRPLPTHPPSENELELVTKIIKDHGPEARTVIDRLASVASSQRFKQSRWFGFCSRIYDEVSAGIKAEKERQRAQAEERQRQAKEREEQARRQERLAYLGRLWDHLACPTWKEEIKATLPPEKPGSFRRPDWCLREMCLLEMDRRREFVAVVVNAAPAEAEIRPELQAAFQKLIAQGTITDYAGFAPSEN